MLGEDPLVIKAPVRASFSVSIKSTRLQEMPYDISCRYSGIKILSFTKANLWLSKLKFFPQAGKAHLAD